MRALCFTPCLWSNASYALSPSLHRELAELGLTPAQAERNGGMRAGYIVDLLRGDPPVHLELQRAEL